MSVSVSVPSADWTKEEVAAFLLSIGVAASDADSAAAALHTAGYKTEHYLLVAESDHLEKAHIPFPVIDVIREHQRKKKQSVAELPQPQENTAATIKSEKIWESVLRIRSDVEGDSATALVFDVYEGQLYLLMNYHYEMSRGNTYYIEFCASDNQFLEVDFFEFDEFKTFAESKECDFVIRMVSLDSAIWDCGKGIAGRKPVLQPPMKRARRKASQKDKTLKAEVICKTPSFSYEGVHLFERVRVFGLPNAVGGRWVAETQVQSLDYRCFYVQALSAPGGSGGAVLATNSGLVVGFVGGANDYHNQKPKQLSSFNTYVMNTHSLPRRPSSAPNSTRGC
ncbi:MAG: hypothetical protein SGILL_008973 [Bacillariaceae sp.]